MSELARGENRPAPGAQLTVTVQSSAGVDVSALLLGTDGRVRSDADFVFFNQPVGPGVTYRHGRGAGDMVDVRTPELPPDVDKVVVAASLDGSGPSTFANVGALVATIASMGEPLTFSISGLSTEAAVVCVEIYRRQGQWKVRAVGQGYDDGLAGIATAFGVNIDDEPEPANQPSTQRVPQPSPSQPGPQQQAQPQQPSQGAQPGYPQQPGYPRQQQPPGSAAQPGHPPHPNQPHPGLPAQAAAFQQGAQPMQSELFNPAHAEVNGLGIQKQGSKMIRVGLNGEVMARAGSMVAYQGELEFKALGSGGIGRAIQHRLTGEGVPLMRVTGQGDLFLADAAAEVHLIDLDGTDGLTINGANVLAFDSALSYKIQRVQGVAGVVGNAGLFNCVFTGRGRIAITTDGSPVVLNVDQATYADPQAAVAWSSSLRTGIKRNDSYGFNRLIGRSTGEGLTLSFTGQGFVIVQPSELPPGGLIGGTGGGQNSGESGGMFGGLLS